ncbi:type II secretion system protein, partial [bacterium]|nr:type II secretion system protein [bacterium]
LAEVLITLGIIGIVAAMTLPSIMARHRSKVLEAQFHKRISEVSQAIMMLKKDEYFSGTLIGEQIASLLASQFKGSIVPDRSIYSAQKQYQKTQIGYELPTYKNYTKTADFRKYKLDDGAIIVSKEFFIFINNDNYSLTNYQIIIDVNGLQKPNIFGYDVFAFELDKTDTLKSMPYSNATKAYCNTTSSDESNGWSCSYYAMTERDYFKNLNW